MGWGLPGRTITVDETSFAVVRRVYELASAGLADREVGAVTGLALKHAAEVLTDPFYADCLWSGEPSALGALIDAGAWEHVQAMRERYSRRHRGSLTRRQYGLGGLLACAACGRRLIGHVGRYRHTDACEPFEAAAPRRVQHDGETLDPRVRGESYKTNVYEQAIGRAFGHVAVSARLKTDTIAEATRPEPEGVDRVLDSAGRRGDADALAVPNRYDLVLDVAGDRPMSALARATRPNGVIVIVGAWRISMLRIIEMILEARIGSRIRGRRIVFFYSRRDHADLETLRDLLAAGSIIPDIEKTYPLGEIADAVRHLETFRTQGKVVVTT